MHDVRRVELVNLPAGLFHRSVTYLRDILRECHLLGLPTPTPVDPHRQELRALAAALVPDLEDMRDLFRSAEVDVDLENDRLDVRVDMSVATAATMAHLQTHLVQLRFFGRQGDLLVESDPEMTKLLAWVWDESADQVHGASARPYRGH